MSGAFAQNPACVPRGTTTSIEARALLDGELAKNTDTERLHIGDGTTAGGLPGALLSDVTTLQAADTALAARLTALEALVTAPATVTIGLSNSDVVADTMRITVTAKDAAGATLAGVHEFVMHMSEATSGIGLTGDTYSGDLTASTGAILGALTAKKAWVIQTADTGIFLGKLVDSARPNDQYVVVKKPLSSGVVVSESSSGKWSTGA